MTGIELNSLLSLKTGALQVSLKITVRNVVFFCFTHEEDIRACLRRQRQRQ
jgi:hypothetical protein